MLINILSPCEEDLFPAVQLQGLHVLHCLCRHLESPESHYIHHMIIMILDFHDMMIVIMIIMFCIASWKFKQCAIYWICNYPCICFQHMINFKSRPVLTLQNDFIVCRHCPTHQELRRDRQQRSHCCTL